MRCGKWRTWLSAGIALSLASYALRAEETALRESKNVHVAEALFHFVQDDPLRAVALLAVAEHFKRLDAQTNEAALLRGVLYLSYGLPGVAEQTLEHLTGQDVAPSVRDQAWFYLAKLHHRRGDFEKAESALKRIVAPLANEMEEECRVLYATVLIERDRPAQAVAILDRLPADSVWAAYGRYNFGVALVRAGEKQRGMTILDQLGGQSPVGDELLALKDKANVALAYTHLQSSESAQARRALERVRIDGLMSNKALLGMGWAYANERQYERALVYWSELKTRDAASLDVHEAWLAAPYALDQLGAHKQSLKEYESAVGVYEAELARLDATIARVRSGEFIRHLFADIATEASTGRPPPARLLDAPGSRYLISLMATHAFQEAVTNHRDLVSLQANLNDAARRLISLEPVAKSRKPAGAENVVMRIEPMRPRLSQLRSDAETARRAQEQAIEQLVVAELERLKWRLIGYRAQARFAVAELTDRANR